MQTEPITRAEAHAHRATVRDEATRAVAAELAGESYTYHVDRERVALSVIDAILHDRETAAAMRALLGA